MGSIAFELSIIAILVLLNGVFAMAEMAMVAAKKGRLRAKSEAGNKGAAAALALAENPDKFLSTVQIGITLIGVLAGTFAGATLSEKLAAWFKQFPPLAGREETIAVAIVVAGITYLSLMFGELLPKNIALRSPEAISIAMARPMTWLSKFASPFVWVLTQSSRLVLAIIRLKPANDGQITEEDVHLLLKESREAGVLEKIESDILSRTVQLDNLKVTKIMTPRPDIVWLNSELSPVQNRNIVSETPHTNFPVHRGNINDIVGVVSVRDMMASTYLESGVKLESLCKEALFIPENVSALRLLETFKNTSSGLAMVLDEYGSIQGIVTLNDVFEAIVGDLPSVNNPADWFMEREDGSYLVDGSMNLTELEERLELGHGDFAVPGVDTLSGLFNQTLNFQSQIGERIGHRGFVLEIIDMDGLRIDKVLMRREEL